MSGLMVHLAPIAKRAQHGEHAPTVQVILDAHDEVSGAEDLHLRALVEPYVTLSRHTAPIVRPRPKSKLQ